MKRLLILAAATVFGVLLPLSSTLAQQASFPHSTHLGFISDCSGCHTGVASGEVDQTYPELSTCTVCHDGSTAPAIQWQAPEARASSLDFSHTAHGFDCTTCHNSGTAR